MSDSCSGSLDLNAPATQRDIRALWMAVHRLEYIGPPRGLDSNEVNADLEMSVRDLGRRVSSLESRLTAREQVAPREEAPALPADLAGIVRRVRRILTAYETDNSVIHAWLPGGEPLTRGELLTLCAAAESVPGLERAARINLEEVEKQSDQIIILSEKLKGMTEARDSYKRRGDLLEESWRKSSNSYTELSQRSAEKLRRIAELEKQLAEASTPAPALREVPEIRCQDNAGSLGLQCELPAGHAGAHESRSVPGGGCTSWGRDAAILPIVLCADCDCGCAARLACWARLSAHPDSKESGK